MFLVHQELSLKPAWLKEIVQLPIGPFHLSGFEVLSPSPFLCSTAAKRLQFPNQFSALSFLCPLISHFAKCELLPVIVFEFQPERADFHFNILLRESSGAKSTCLV